MTATQAPTPGPLSVTIGQIDLDRLRSIIHLATHQVLPFADKPMQPFSAKERAGMQVEIADLIINDIGKANAPTAPVEASGSERERLISVMRDHIELGEIGSCSAEIVGHEEAADAILALRPPARAEAQDEGAAGEISAAIQRVKAVADEGIVVEVYGDFPRPFHTFKGDLRALLARAHPSPTPAADADRVRPSLWWNAEDWEVTRCDLEDAYEDATAGEMRGVAKIGNAHEFDPIYAVRIDIDTTGDGEADDYEIKTFPTKEEADAYLADALKSTAAKEGGK